MQVYHNADSEDQSFFEYENGELEESLGSYLHDVGEAEFRGSWARFRVDLGTCDELALDVLVSGMRGGPGQQEDCGVWRKPLDLVH